MKGKDVTKEDIKTKNPNKDMVRYLLIQDLKSTKEENDHGVV